MKTHSLTRMIQRTLYSLKRQYGDRIDVYRLDSASTDTKTGVKTITTSVFPIVRAPVLPVKMTREAIQSISQISANKAFVQAAAGFVRGLRTFVIDRGDLPAGFVLKNDDWIVFNNRRFDPVAIQDFEYDAGYLVTALEIADVRPEQIFLMAADNLLRFSQTVVKT